MFLGFLKSFHLKWWHLEIRLNSKTLHKKIAEYFNIKSGIWLSFILNFLFPHYILYFCSCLASCAEFLRSLSHAAKCLLQQLSAFCFQPLPSNQPACKKKLQTCLFTHIALPVSPWTGTCERIPPAQWVCISSWSLELWELYSRSKDWRSCCS